MSKCEGSRGALSGVGGVAFLVLSGVVIAGCGDRFAEDSCQQTHTCGAAVGAAGGAEQEPAGISGSAGSSRGGSQSTAGTEQVGEAGTFAAEGGAGGAGSSGAAGDGNEPLAGAGGAAFVGCQSAAECSNQEPSDGEEVCGQDGVCGPGNPPPSVLSVTPANKAVNADPEGTVVLTFSEPLDPATVTAANVKVLDGNVVVPGVVSYADSKVTFTPDAPFSLLAPYKVSVAVAVTDAQGAGLLKAHASTFTVRDGKWSATSVLTGTVTAVSPGLPMTEAGDVLASWITKGGAANYCPTTARRYLRGLPTAAAKPLTATVGDCAHVRAAGNAAGVAVVAWLETDSGYWAMQYRNGAWSAAKVKVSADTFRGLVNVAVAPDGVVHLVELGSTGGRAWHTNAQGVWSATADTLSSATALSSAQMAFDSAGNGFAVWSGKDSIDVQKEYTSRYTASTGKWATATVLTGSDALESTAGYGRGAPAVAVDSAGGAVALWVKQAGPTIELMANRRTQAGAWAAPVSIGGSSGSMPLVDPPALVFDGTTFIAAYSRTVAKLNNTYTVRFDSVGQAWQAPALQSDGVLSGAARMPQLGADARGNLLLVWPRVKAAANAFDFVFRRFASVKAEWSTEQLIAAGAEAQVIDDQFEEAGGTPFPLSVSANGLGALMWGSRGATYFEMVRLASFN